MSDYDWECPSCGELIFYNDPAYYSASLDDNVCSECHDWMATDDEVRAVTNAMHIAEAMANDRGVPIAVSKDLNHSRTFGVNQNQIVEVIRPKHLANDLNLL